MGYPGGPEGPISVFGKFNLWAKVILKNNNDEEYLLTNESALGKITKGTFGPYPCALLTLNKEEKILDFHYLMEDGWRIATKNSFDIEKPPIPFSKTPYLNGCLTKFCGQNNYFSSFQVKRTQSHV